MAETVNRLFYNKKTKEWIIAPSAPDNRNWVAKDPYKMTGNEVIAAKKALGDKYTEYENKKFGRDSTSADASVRDKANTLQGTNTSTQAAVKPVKTETWQDRIKAGTASDEDMKTAFDEYKAGRYTPGPKTQMEFNKMEGKTALDYGKKQEGSITNNESKDVNEVKNDDSTENNTPINTNGENITEPPKNTESTDFNLGNKTKDAPEGNSNGGGNDDNDNKKLKDFWNKFRAGAFKAYPWLQTIGDAIGKNARMTADRAALLTGGQRDPEAYNTVNPEEHMTGDYKVQSAILDAKAGNMNALGALIASGDITLENAATALNMSPEALEQKFGQTMRTGEAETKSKELDVQQKELNMVFEKNAEARNIMEEIRGAKQLKVQLQSIKAELSGDAIESGINKLQAIAGLIGGTKTVSSTSGTSGLADSNGNVSSNADWGLKDDPTSTAQSWLSGAGKEAVRFVEKLAGATTATSTSGVSQNPALANLLSSDAVKNYLKYDTEQRNAANNEIKASIDSSIAELDAQIAELENQYSQLTGRNVHADEVTADSMDSTVSTPTSNLVDQMATSAKQ